MILALFFVTGVLVSPTIAQMSIEHFGSEIESKCYNFTLDQSRLFVDGQEKPLAHTLENFISLVVKLELANPDLKLEDEVFLLLRNFTSDNLIQESGGIVEWTPEGSNYQKYIENLWQQDSAKRENVPSHMDPFTDDEKCSLFFMLSHTVNDTARRGIDSDVRFFAEASDGAVSRDAPKTRCPREQGVVSIGMSTHAVALSRVVMGIYLGLNPNRAKNLIDILENADKVPPEIADRTVDPLYLLTLADMLVLAKWPFSKTRREFGGNGKWQSINFKSNIDTDEICPLIYELAVNETSLFTYSSVRGGVDGLILGSIIEDISRDSSNEVRLSQILRMYYSQRGIPEHSQLSPQYSASFCNRMERIGEMTERLQNQIDLYIVLILKDYKKFSELSADAWRNFDAKRGEILTVDQALNGFCKKPPTIDSMQNIQGETATDVIVVMDSVNHDTLERQQMIIGYLANSLNLYHGGSTITILLDQQNGTVNLDLNEVIPQTSSSACAACLVTQFSFGDYSGNSDKEIVLQSIDKLLETKKKDEEGLSGVPGKIVVYFNFNDEEPTMNYRLRKVLKDLHMRHQDVPIYAAGKNLEVLKKYARNNGNDAIPAVDARPNEVADNLSKKIREGPATLQFTNCKDGKDERAAIYEGSITPNLIQHWAMSPEYFYKSYTVKIFFEIQDGNIQVCHSRATSRPELQKKNCHTTNSTARRLEFKHSNPCKGFTSTSCAPFYFSVIGIDEINNQGSTARAGKYCQNTKETTCKTLDQIQFKVSHEGVRCSGCMGLFSTQILLLISSLIVYYLFAKDH